MTQSPPDSLLAVHDLSMHFGGVAALAGVNVSLGRGETVGLIGPNGSGKTTLLNILTGIYRQTHGTVTFDGHDISRMQIYRRGRRGMLRTFQHPQLAQSLTLRENVALGLVHASAPDGVTDEDWADGALRIFGCAAYADRLPTESPYGFQKMAEIARAAVARPTLLLLDEPAAGLNQDERAELVEALRNYRSTYGKSTTICLIEHDLVLVRALCPALYVLNAGRIITHGDTTTVLDAVEVRMAYLGESELSEGNAS